jgi:hypothetical protein
MCKRGRDEISNNSKKKLSHRPYNSSWFKNVEVFEKYLGVNTNSDKNMHDEINDRVVKLLKSKLLSRNSNTLLYNTAIYDQYSHTRERNLVTA